MAFFPLIDEIIINNAAQVRRRHGDAREYIKSIDYHNAVYYFYVRVQTAQMDRHIGPSER